MRALVIMICMLVLVGSLSASGFALSGAGTRAISMGGAMRGLSDDYSAMYWNPAGMAFFTQSELALSLATITPGTTYEADGLNWPGIEEGKEITAEDKTWAFPNLYYVHEGSSNWNYGIGFFVPYGLGAEWDIYQFPSTMPADINGDGTAENVPITWTNMEKCEFESSIAITDLHPAVSYKINDKLSVGGGISIHYGMIEIDKLYPHYTGDPASSKYTYLPTYMHLEGSGWGVGGNFGLMYKHSERFSVGLSGKLPTTMYMTGTSEVTTYVNSLIASADGNTANNDPYDATSKPDVKAKLNLPGDLGLGFAVKPLCPLTVTADITWTGWSHLEKITLEFDGLTPDLPYLGKPEDDMADTDLNTNWDDGLRYSLGLEYDCGAHFGLNRILFRGGYHFDPTPIPDESLNPTWPDVGDISSFNLGLGLNLGNYGLDLGFETMTFVDRTIDTQVWTSNNKPDNMPGHYDTWLSAFNATLTYSF